MKKKIAICWFRQDLRLNDNPALTLAAIHSNVLPIYILDDGNAGKYAMGGASRWWLYHSLKSLSYSLNNNLSLYRGDPVDVLADLINRYDVEALYWNRCYEPWRINRDSNIKEYLTTKNIPTKSTNGSLLWEPWEIKKNDNTPYKVFTPFYHKGCLQAVAPRRPLAAPQNVKYQFDEKKSLNIDQLGLLSKVHWYDKLTAHWQIGESFANHRLQQFIKHGLSNYKEGRNIPSKPYVSRISAHLHFGEISPNDLWYAIRNAANDKNSAHFCSELGWREFSYSQLYYNQTLPYKNLQAKFDKFPWEKNLTALKAWQAGKTGIPMVDAGMRELWQTGYMHNRSRLIAGSFLVKNLLLHWQHGERWFWDTLVDADLANNSASWQWIAGCGADAAPYFRIFNPVMQGQRFDPQGEYVRQYIPEIAKLPIKYLFSPWEVPADLLKKTGIKLGKTYPNPIIDLQKSRDKALAAFKSLKP